MENREALELTLLAGLSGNLAMAHLMENKALRAMARALRRMAGDGRRHVTLQNTLPIIFQLVSCEAHGLPLPEHQTHQAPLKESKRTEFTEFSVVSSSSVPVCLLNWTTRNLQHFFAYGHFRVLERKSEPNPNDLL